MRLWDSLIGLMGGRASGKVQFVVPVAFGRQVAWRPGAFVTSYVEKLRGDMFNDDVRHRALVHAARRRERSQRRASRTSSMTSKRGAGGCLCSTHAVTLTRSPSLRTRPRNVASTHCRQEGGQADRHGAHFGHWQDAAVHGKYAGGRFTFVARFYTYTISLLADQALQWK